MTSHECHGTRNKLLFTRLFRLTLKKTPRPALLAPLSGESNSHIGPVTRKAYPCHEIIMKNVSCHVCVLIFRVARSVIVLPLHALWACQRHGNLAEHRTTSLNIHYDNIECFVRSQFQNQEYTSYLILRGLKLGLLALFWYMTLGSHTIYCDNFINQPSNNKSKA